MKLESVEYAICMNQGRLYRHIAQNGYDVERFSNAYLSSDFCRRAFDTTYSRFQMADVLECMDFIEPEIKEEIVPYREGFFDEDVAAWIGFTYRHLYMETEIPSKMLTGKISFSSMCAYYPGLHTIDFNEALDIIRKDYSLFASKAFMEEET